MTTEPSIIISLSTVPERLQNEDEDGLKLVLTSLCEQTDNDYEVHINIPEIYNITNQEYIIPKWLISYEQKYSRLKVCRTTDYGPPTKLIPTLERIKNPETIILVVDDDLVYHSEMVAEHRKYQEILSDSVICYDGRGSNFPIYFDIRDSWIICVTDIRETHFLQHYKSASYKRKLFNTDFFEKYCGKTMSDDVLVSKYFRNTGVKMFVVPYEKDNHLYSTRELWDVNQGVTSFPILRYASSVENSGCKNPELLKIQLPFYDPVDWGLGGVNVVFNNSDNFNTDKINHGYMHVYSPIFEKNKTFKKILEIGIYNGDSLKLLSYFFNDAIIYGADINDCSHLNGEKIKTQICNQENVEDLKSLCDLINDEIDMIIDDGGHTMKQQQISLGYLFKHLKSGGIYIVEDLHTSNWPNSGYITSDDSITTLDMLNTFNDTGKILSNHMSEDEISFLEENIESIVIWSRTPNFDESVTSIIIKK